MGDRPQQRWLAPSLGANLGLLLGFASRDCPPQHLDRDDLPQGRL